MNTKTIQAQMKSIKSIGKITKTMEMVSVAKMRRAQTRANRGKQFSVNANRLFASISRDAKMSHPLVKSRPTAQTYVYIVISSDKGMCGGFNVQIVRELLRKKELHNQSGESMAVYAVGKYSEKLARRAGVPIYASFGLVVDALDISVVSTIIKMAIDHYTTDESIHTISVVSQLQTGSSATTQVMNRQLLPFANIPIDTTKPLANDTYSFEPSTTLIITRLLSGVLQSVLGQYMLESLAAEHTMRMVAMKNATDNANNLYDDLVLSYNKARQSAITQEISEIVGGANALAD